MTVRKSRLLPSFTAVVLAAAALLAGPAAAQPTPASSPGSPSLCADAASPMFGPYVCVFTPTMSQSAIQADLDAIATQQVPYGSQFDSSRYSLLFSPGSYGSTTTPLVFQVGYYEQVAGLGAMPQDTVINGLVEVFANDCAVRSRGTIVNQDWCNSTSNFWRSLSNLEINEVKQYNPAPTYAPALLDPSGEGCSNSEQVWSVAQAAPIRRTLITGGDLEVADYCSGPAGDMSGGFIADTQVDGKIVYLAQQQYLTRDSQSQGAAGCPGGLWNDVFAGMTGTAITPMLGGTCKQNTVVPATTRTEEQPFLYDGAQGWQVFVPSPRQNASGTSWSTGSEAGSSLPLSRFFIATPQTSVLAINLALALGKDLVLTPGIYHLRAPIIVSRPDTVVLGLGFATLTPDNGSPALIALPDHGVKISGLIIDAGAVNSPVLVSVGTPGHDPSAAADPDLLSDVFFRIGGAQLGKATVSLLDNAPSSILDDIWAWRADHGVAGSVGWTVNTADTGVFVTGDDVTAYGLAVEHYQKNEVIWTGQGGSVTFFQNELPYDPPSQAAWNPDPHQLGYPAFLITPNVKNFNGTGFGSYVAFINTQATLYVDAAFKTPQTPGVRFQTLVGVWIAGAGGFNSIINGTGGPVTSNNPGTVEPVSLVSYP